VNTINECIYNVLNGNSKLIGCSKRELRKHNAALLKVANKRVSLSSKKNSLFKEAVFVASLEPCFTDDR